MLQPLLIEMREAVTTEKTGTMTSPAQGVGLHLAAAPVES